MYDRKTLAPLPGSTDIFVIGGGLSGLPELVEELGARASRYTFSGSAAVKVARAHHGEKSGVRGAARLWS